MNTLTEKRNLLDELEYAFLRGEGTRITSRKKAFDAFLSKGLPGNKSEEYKFTPVTRTLEKILDLTSYGDKTIGSIPASIPLIPGMEGNVIAFMNGIFFPGLSHTPDLKIECRKDDPAEPGADSFDLLNQAFHHEVVEIHIESNKVIPQPVFVIYFFDSPNFVFANPRWILKMGNGSSVSVIEYGSGPGPLFFNNKHSRIEVGQKASLNYATIQNGPDHDVQVNNSIIHAAGSSNINCYTYTFSGELVRNNLTLIIDGENIEAHLHGLYLISGNTLADNHTVVDHQKPNSFSNEFYKGVLNDHSRGVFNGKIFVRPDAQKTNAFQSNRNILLNEAASVNTKPQLEIWADDVKCSHGCTTGQLDEEALFYLQSRGIPKDHARAMLLHAFAWETIAPLKIEILQNYLDGIISGKLLKNF